MKHLLPLTLALLAGCTVIPRGAPPPVPSEPSSSDSYSASGTEPGWTLKVTSGRLSYEGDYGATRIDVPRPEARTTFNGHRYETARLTVDVTHGECSDGMSDRLYEDSVTVTADGKTVKGCGGAILSPQTLEGTDWVILRVGEMDALADRPADIAFTNGRVSGTTGCNRFSGSYDVNTTALTLGPLAATKMACPGTAMEQENKLLAILKGTIGMTFRNGDTLILTGANGRTVTLRRKI